MKSRKLEQLICCFILFTAVMITSCVSVKFIPEEMAKSNQVSWKAPKAPFKQFFPEHLDMAWKDPKNRSISFLSECGGDERISLSEIHKGLARSIENSRPLRKMPLSVSGHEALRSIVEGRVNGRVSIADLVVLKVQKCTYILNYVAERGDYESGLPFFENFLQNFRVKQ